MQLCCVLCCLIEIPEDPYIESTGYWQDISVDQSDDDVWKTTDMGWGVYPEVTDKEDYFERHSNSQSAVVHVCVCQEPLTVMCLACMYA